MIHVSSSLPDIAVLRGGSSNFKKSLSEGMDVLQSLTKIGYKPLDVVIDTDGNWTVQGLPTDAHFIFSKCHTVVDVTRMRNKDYHLLAIRMGISVIFSVEDEMNLSREDMYRILRQQGFKVPDTTVIRASTPIEDSMWRHIWSTYHTPLLVRPLEKNTEASGKLVKIFGDLEKVVTDYHSRGIDVHILTYKKAPTTSLAVLPNFRGERLYTPVWVETFSSIENVPNNNSPMRAHLNAPDYRKEQIRKIAMDAYDALGINSPACIDMVPHNNDYVVVNIDITPSLRKDSRFMQSLATTGIDSGEYIHSKIKEEYGI